MTKKAVLFDLDDTLYDYSPAHKKHLMSFTCLFLRKSRFQKIDFLKYMK